MKAWEWIENHWIGCTEYIIQRCNGECRVMDTDEHEVCCVGTYKQCQDWIKANWIAYQESLY